MRGLLAGHRQVAWLPGRHNHRTVSRRGRTITQGQLARRERRERRGDAGLTGEAARVGRPYMSGVHVPGTRLAPMPAPVPPVAEQRRGRRRPDGHRRAGENAANGWT